MLFSAQVAVSSNRSVRAVFYRKRVRALTNVICWQKISPYGDILPRSLFLDKFFGGKLNGDIETVGDVWGGGEL